MVWISVLKVDISIIFNKITSIIWIIILIKIDIFIIIQHIKVCSDINKTLLPTSAFWFSLRVNGFGVPAKNYPQLVAQIFQLKFKIKFSSVFK